MRTDWVALPEAVKTEIAGRVGGVPAVIPASSGDHAEIAATVTGPVGKVFVKAASSEFGVRSLRYELLASRGVARQSSSARLDNALGRDGSRSLRRSPAQRDAERGSH